MFEIVVHNHTYENIQNHELFYDIQFGFRKWYSTDKCLTNNKRNLGSEAVHALVTNAEGQGSNPIVDENSFHNMLSTSVAPTSKTKGRWVYGSVCGSIHLCLRIRISFLGFLSSRHIASMLVRR